MSDSENEEQDVDFDEIDPAIYKPSFVLIAIDTHPSMFVKNEDSGTSPFMDAVSACHAVADSLIFTQSKRTWSQFGIILANNDDGKNSFVEFQVNLLESIKFLKQKKQLSNEELSNDYMRKGDFDLGSLFLLCKKKFKDVKSAFYKRTLIYITNDDDPIKNEATKKFTALNEVNTFEASDISFQLITMNPNFDYTKFYNELFSLANTSVVEQICEDEGGLTEKLLSTVVMRYTQRKIYFYPFAGDSSRFLKVVKFDLISSANLYDNAQVSTEGKELKKVNQDQAEANEFFLKLEFDILTFQLHEKLHVRFNELPIGLTLLYVGNRQTDVGVVLSDSSLLQVDPKEELPFFSSFWQYCADNNKVLVCLRKLKQLDKIRYVELIPKYANGAKIFLIKSIPFLNEFQTNDEEEFHYDAAPNQIKAVDELIDALTFDYYPELLFNPSLRQKKAYVRSKLLDEPVEEVVEVAFNNKAMDAKIEDIVASIRENFGFMEESTKKRKAESSTSRSKKVK